MSSALLKKAGKANKAHARTDSSPPVNNAGAATSTDEAYDVSGLESQVLKAIEKLTHELSQLRSGGKMNPDIVESLKVQLGTVSEGKETVRLGDIAQVVPRGRVLNVICGEESVRPHPISIRDTIKESKINTAIAHQTHILRHRRLRTLPHPALPRVLEPLDHPSTTAPADGRVAARSCRPGAQGVGEGG